ncbi:MAG: hypothetical protein ACRDUA_12925, partial [Micromonosporaceae bacterium]
VFRYVELHHAVVPCYQLSSFGFLVASDQPPPDREAIAAACAVLNGQSRYLTAETYRASQVIPPYLSHLAPPAED